MPTTGTCNLYMAQSNSHETTTPPRCIQIEKAAELDSVAEAAQSGSGIEGVTEVAGRLPKNRN